MLQNGWLYAASLDEGEICCHHPLSLFLTSQEVTSRYVDRRLNKSKSKTLKGEKFLKLFTEHILPQGFVRIRHVGFLSSRSKKKDLALIRKSLKVGAPLAKPKLSTRQFIMLTTSKDPYQCPCCNKGEMVIVSVLPSIRGSPISSMFRTFASDRSVQII